MNVPHHINSTIHPQNSACSCGGTLPCCEGIYYYAMKKNQIKYLAFVIGLVTAMILMKYY